MGSWPPANVRLLEMKKFYICSDVTHTHTPKAGVTLGDLQMLQKRLVVFRFTVPVENPDIGIPAKGNRRCLRFQTPDLQLQIQGEDLTYV